MSRKSRSAPCRAPSGRGGCGDPVLAGRVAGQFAAEHLIGSVLARFDHEDQFVRGVVLPT